MTDRALLLAPSQGLGGGIERYVETLEWAFAEQGIEYTRVDLHDRHRRLRASAHARVVTRCRRQLRASAGLARLVVAHRALLPMALLLARERSVAGISVICHGSDVWDRHLRPRWHVEKFIMRRPTVRVVAASSFTSGVLSSICQATVLPPGLSQEWFDTLVKASTVAKTVRPRIHLVTAFRLADWRGKGLLQLLEAVAVLGRPDIDVTVCGSGEPPRELQNVVREYSTCRLLPGLTDRELACQFADADLFVLATRTKLGRNASGEGFGLALLEAQIAGTPVVVPAYGGSHDAYIDGATGVAPTDESAEALACVLDEVLRDRRQLAQMGDRAAEWARVSFAPERYAPLAVARLL